MMLNPERPERAGAWQDPVKATVEVHGSPADFTADSFFNHVEAVLQADTVEEVWALHTRKMSEYDFDRLIYAFTRFHRGVNETALDDLLILSNFSQAYLDGYFGRDHYRNGPMTRWAVENDGACSWRRAEERLEQGVLTEPERSAMAFNRSMGVVAGYSISFRDLSTRSKGAIGLCARSGLRQTAVDALWQEHGREILLMNQIMHLRISTLPFVLERRGLTPRQREVLEWVSDGKTTHEIASLMGVTITTVEKHLRLAREALGVETTTQAVLKASFHNQIFQFNRKNR